MLRTTWLPKRFKPELLTTDRLGCIPLYPAIHAFEHRLARSSIWLIFSGLYGALAVMFTSYAPATASWPSVRPTRLVMPPGGGYPLSCDHFSNLVS